MSSELAEFKNHAQRPKLKITGDGYESPMFNFMSIGPKLVDGTLQTVMEAFDTRQPWIKITNKA